jgi:hypothetical protein
LGAGVQQRCGPILHKRVDSGWSGWMGGEECGGRSADGCACVCVCNSTGSHTDEACHENTDGCTQEKRVTTPAMWCVKK